MLQRLSPASRTHVLPTASLMTGEMCSLRFARLSYVAAGGTLGLDRACCMGSFWSGFLSQASPAARFPQDFLWPFHLWRTWRNPPSSRRQPCSNLRRLLHDLALPGAWTRLRDTSDGLGNRVTPSAPHHSWFARARLHLPTSSSELHYATHRATVVPWWRSNLRQTLRCTQYQSNNNARWSEVSTNYQLVQLINYNNNRKQLKRKQQPALLLSRRLAIFWALPSCHEMTCKNRFGGNMQRHGYVDPTKPHWLMTILLL